MVVVSILKWAQILLAILLTGFFVLLLPGIGAFGVPLGCLYIAWAVRARSDHRLSVRLAFVFTLMVMLWIGPAAVFGLARMLSGQAIPVLEVSIYLTLSLLAATVVVLHGFSWRWLFAPDRIYALPGRLEGAETP